MKYYSAHTHLVWSSLVDEDSRSNVRLSLSAQAYYLNRACPPECPQTSVPETGWPRSHWSVAGWTACSGTRCLLRPTVRTAPCVVPWCTSRPSNRPRGRPSTLATWPRDRVLSLSCRMCVCVCTRALVSLSLHWSSNWPRERLSTRATWPEAG